MKCNMSRILSKEEKAEKLRKSDLTYKIITHSLTKLEKAIDILRKVHGSEKVHISPIMKDQGSNDFHCFFNVLSSNSKEKGE